MEGKLSIQPFINSDQSSNQPLEMPEGVLYETNNQNAASGGLTGSVNPNSSNQNKTPAPAQPAVSQKIPEAGGTTSPAVPNLPAKKRSKLWLVIVLIVLVIFIALVVLAETGYLPAKLLSLYDRSRIYTFWGGLSPNPKTAFIESSQKTNQLASYQSNLNLDLTYNPTKINVGRQTSSNKQSRVFNQIPKTFAQSTASSTVDANIHLNQTINNNQSQVDFDVELPQNILSSLSGGAVSELTDTADVNGQAVFVNNQGYLKSAYVSAVLKLENNKWILVPYLNLAEQNVAAIILKLNQSQLDQMTISDQKLKSGLFGPDSAYKYELTFDNAKWNKALNNHGLAELGITSGTSTIQLWVNRQNHYIQKISLQTNSGGQKISGDLEYSNYNNTAEIKKPSKGETASVSADSLKQLESALLGSSLKNNNSSANAADTKRKEDLQSIKDALETYDKENNQYPIATQAIKLSDSGNVLQVALVEGGYLDVLPTDPAAGKYYGYQSDGKTYTLTCVLDSSTDASGQKAGSANIYKLINDAPM